MKTLYLECQMGAAGDMLMAALLELLPEPDQFLHIMNALPGIGVTAEKSVKCGITGTHVTVTVHGEEETEHQHHPAHSTMADICHAIDKLPVSDTVRTRAKAVYKRIAAAESAVHGEPVEAIHFHEVGAWDAVADVVGVCLAMEQLSPDRIIVSPVHVGSGTVRCAHGVLPVPAPATALLLQGVPVYGGAVQGELCTPTGAALLREFAHEFGNMPVMTVENIGYGMGTKEFDRPNCVRAFWGKTDSPTGAVTEIVCNLDDMTGEVIGFAMEQLLEAGALDVFTTPIGMKKSRPGIMLTCICRSADREQMTALMLKYTTTLGVRYRDCSRATMKRYTETVETPYGPVRIKHAEGWGVHKSKPEYEDLAKAARSSGISIEQVLK